MSDVVATLDEAAAPHRRPPLVVLDRLEAFLDERGFGAGSLSITVSANRRSSLR